MKIIQILKKKKVSYNDPHWEEFSYLAVGYLGVE